MRPDYEEIFVKAATDLVPTLAQLAQELAETNKRLAEIKQSLDRISASQAILATKR